jgi:hypothetical protein
MYTINVVNAWVISINSEYVFGLAINYEKEMKLAHTQAHNFVNARSFEKKMRHYKDAPACEDAHAYEDAETCAIAFLSAYNNTMKRADIYAQRIASIHADLFERELTSEYTNSLARDISYSHALAMSFEKKE